MRTFDDANGGHWQVALMEASYGTVVLVFGRIAGDQVLRLPLDTEVANLNEAMELVAKLDEAGLCAFLAQAVPWNG